MIEIQINSTRGRLVNCPYSIAKYLYEKCSYQFEGYEFSDAYLNGFWDGYVRKFSIKTHSFPSGLLFRIQKYLKKKKVKYVVVDCRNSFKWNQSQIVKSLENFKFALRPYQVDGLIMGLKIPYMVYWWATGSGKTVQFSALIRSLKRKDFRRTLILVANKDLATQHRTEVGSMIEDDIGLIQEGKFEPKTVTVAVINTLWQKALKKKDQKIVKYLESIEHLIVDEVHRSIDSKMFRQTINKCKNTIARHGFSGTPFSLTTDDLELESVTGPPLSRVSVSRLIREGWSSRPHVTMLKYDSSYFSERYSHRTYNKGIVENEIRSNIVASIADYEYYREEKPSILIIVRIIKHGKIIADKLEEIGFSRDEYRYIHGSSPDVSRMKVKEALKRKEIRLVIASQIWNEGIDIPSVDVLIKADAGGGGEIKSGKGIRSVIQQVGRVIRKPVVAGNIDVDTEKENEVRIYDFFDDCQDDLRRWSSNRFMTYKMEKEFIVRRTSYDAWKSGK